jgi:membrane protease YdiL (CAAX protease family)
MATPFEQPLEPSPRRGQPLVAWIVIGLAVVTAFVGQLWLDRKGQAKKQTDYVMLEMQARQLVAVAQLDHAQGPKLFHDAEPQFNHGSEAGRLRGVVLAGELVGPDEALRQLQNLDTPSDDPHVAELLERLYKDYQGEKRDAPSLSGADRAELRDKLGWFGELALNPQDGPDDAARHAILQPAQNALVIFLGFVVCIFALGVVGANILIVMTILVAQRKVRMRFDTGSPNGGIYAETFALWMVLFMGLGLGASFVPAGQHRILLAGLAALGSLSALAWPVLRGVPWPTVRQEIGLVWTNRPLDTVVPQTDDPYIGYPHNVGWEERPNLPKPVTTWAWLEPLNGVVGYVGTLPLLFIGAMITLGLMRLAKMVFGEGGDPWGLTSDPNHPIGGFILTANWWGKLQVIFAASVGAPIVEETMFRGVLYRHLREATGRWARWWSVLASAVVVSFVFAVIHPQGLLGVPALMSLAIGFSLAREWRGSLVPSMVAHGLNNFVVTLVLLLSMG